MQTDLAREPILDRLEGVYGYELRFRHDEEIWPKTNGEAVGPEPAAGESVFDELEDLTDGTRAFVKCPRAALVGGSAAGLPSDRVVLEVQAAPEPDAEVLKACRDLKEAGFLIALERFHGAWEEPLADVAKMIKLDVTALAERAQWLFIKKYRPQGTVLIADNVQTRVQFQSAIQQGYSYYQGKFFLRPQPYASIDVAPTKLVYLLALGAVTRPEIDIQEVARIIKHDLALSYRLLRFLNSARFALHSPVTSIRHALMMLGQNELRKWIGMISVAALGEGGPPILVGLALIRAAFCESMAPLLGDAKRQTDYFFLGLLSAIDVLLRRPMRVILAELPIEEDVSAALIGEQNPLRDVLRIVLGYEEGAWHECSELARKLPLKDDKLSELYSKALRWSRELTHLRPEDFR